MTKLEHALALAAAGFRVFPLRPNEKVPAITDWTKTATIAEDQIHLWWLAAPDANIGILCSDLLVLDVDVKGGKDGESVLRDYELLGDDLPRTRIHRSASGGRHIFLQPPVPVANGVDVLGSGVDVRGKNGYVVAPGSVVDGREYVVEDAAPVQPAPEWVVAKCKRPRGRPAAAGKSAPSSVDQGAAARRATAYLALEAPTSVEGAHGDATAYRVACRVKDYGVNEDMCWALMLDHWNERCAPPWDAQDLFAKVRHAYRYGHEPVGVNAPEVDFAKVEDAEVLPDTLAKAHPVLEFNKEFALTLLPGKGHAVLWETTDAEGRPTLRFLPEPTFHTFMRSAVLDTGEKKYQVSQLWMASPDRRTYRGTCFRPQQPAAPGYYNLWRGFAVEPYAGDICNAPAAWRKAVDDWQSHALNNICQGDFEHFDWLMRWFGHLVQRPWEKPQVAVALRGPKGTGKNALFERVAALFGDHAMVAADRRYLLSNFNAHMEKTLLLVLDEAFWAGDKAGEGVLKGLVTGAEHQIEKKGQDSYKAKNLTRVGIIGNEDWIVPASEDERRYAVFEVGTGKRRANRWFAEMREAMEAGGYSLLLRTLLDVDLTDFDLAHAPETVGLMKQKLASLPIVESWWHECLFEGEIVGAGYDRWPETLVTKSAYASLQAYHQGIRSRERLPDLRRMTNTLRAKLGIQSKQVMVDGVRESKLLLPPLEECRRMFAEKMGGVVTWQDS